MLDISGFFWITVRDKNKQDESMLGQVFFPLQELKAFTPMHLQVVLPKAPGQTDDSEASLFVTICLEKPISSSVDQLCYPVLNWASFDPLPQRVTRFAVAMSRGPLEPTVKIEFSKV